MNLRLTVAALLGLAAGASASAQEAVQDFRNEILSTRTRAEVRTELERARLAGELERRNHAYGGFERSFEAPSGVTRAAVLAELQRARDARELDLRNYSGPGTGPAAVATPARADAPAVADKATRRSRELPAS